MAGGHYLSKQLSTELIHHGVCDCNQLMIFCFVQVMCTSAGVTTHTPGETAVCGVPDIRKVWHTDPW